MPSGPRRLGGRSRCVTKNRKRAAACWEAACGGLLEAQRAHSPPTWDASGALSKLLESGQREQVVLPCLGQVLQVDDGRRVSAPGE
jgi:hypothetical protein